MAKRKKPQSCKSGFAWDVDMKKCVPEGQAKKPPRQPPGGRKSAVKDFVDLVMMGPPTFGWPATLDKVLKKKKKNKKKSAKTTPSTVSKRPTPR